MSRAQRIALVGLALAGVVVAFLVLRPGGDDSDGGAAQTTTQANTTTQPETITTPTTVATEPPPPPPPPETVVNVRGLQPLGGVAQIRVQKGDTVRLRVTSDEPEEVHIHGYDLSKDVDRGQPAQFRFAASLEGVFEIEIEHAAVEIARLVVSP